MISGSDLAAQAKHTPDLLDMNDVRYAGRVLERYQELLRTLRAVKINDDDVELTFVVDHELWESVAYHKYGE